jgi:hypothetical protein
MAQNFIASDREQSFLLPPDVRGWLPEGHFAWFVLDVVEELDLDSFYVVYHRDGMGRLGHRPAGQNAGRRARRRVVPAVKIGKPRFCGAFR